MCWCTPTTPVVERLKQVDGKFKVSLGYTASSRLAWTTFQVLDQLQITDTVSKIKKIKTKVGDVASNIISD